jgi:hypothetical protein
MSRADGRMIWRAIDQAEKCEVAEFNREITTIGRTRGIELVAQAFYDWALAVKPKDVGQAIMQIARENTADQKFLCAAKISGIWQ